jgi:hypothetical protein
MLLPIKLIFFQIIFLLITITVEAQILYRSLAITRQTAIRYATVINLYSTVIGWLFIFITQHLIPENIKLNIIDYLILGNVSNNLTNWEDNIISIFLGLILLLLTCYLEFKILLLLQAILSRTEATDLKLNNTQNINIYHRIQQAILQNDIAKILTIIKANLLSYIAVRIMIFTILELRS